MTDKLSNLVDVVGSFLLPDELLQARAQYSAGAIDYDSFKRIEDKAIEQLVEHQTGVGLKEVTSGEFRRNDWDKDFWFGLEGISCERVDSGHLYQPLDSFTDLVRFSGRIAYNPSHPFFDDFAYLYKITNGRAQCRQTIPSPANLYLEILSTTADGRPAPVYADSQSLLADIAEAYNKTLKQFYNLGCRHLQFDDTACGLLSDKTYTKRLLQGGIDPIHLHEQLIALFNNSIACLPTDMELSLYISGGDTIVPEWGTQNYVDSIMPKVLSQVRVAKFFIPFDMGRDSQLEVLRHIPLGKKVVLGLVDAHSPFADKIERVRPAFEKTAQYIQRQNLSVSPKSGFKLTSFATRGLTYEDQWNKIAQISAVMLK